MSNSIRTIVVTMETNVSEEYVDEYLIPGIKCMKGVLKVDKEVEDHNTYFALENARRELGNKLWEVLYSKKAG